jgi:N-acetylglucosaminyl-diphospho-decaprenol L-rhamnosyltransferase
MNTATSGAPDLAVVIVSFNTCDLLRECLRSVYASDLGGLTLAVTVVDNDSRDDSVAMVRNEYPAAHIITNRSNVGYPAANNQGLRHFGYPGDKDKAAAIGGEHVVEASHEVASLSLSAHPLPRYALLLNPDTVLPPEALAEMAGFLESHPRAGVVGPKLVRLDGSLDKACRRSFPTPEVSAHHMLGLDRAFPNSPRFARYNLTFLPVDETAKVEAVVGAFMMVRGEAIRQAGLLDEAFFMYGEDLDWAKRISDVGWEVWYHPHVTVLHVKEAASRHSYRARVEFYRAMTIFYNKHYRATTPFYLDWLIRGGVVCFGGLDLFLRRIRGQYRRAPHTVKA